MRPMPELAITELPVDALVPYAGNAKIHTDKQVDEIAASIAEFGNCDPIAVWTNAEGRPEIVEGHGRVLALRKLGIATCPVVFLDHLTDEQRRAYTHVHNQTTLSSGFDMEALCADMGELDYDWEAFGFDARADWFEMDGHGGTERQEGNDEYNDFLEKFEPKKTTDDCYTPPEIYATVLDWAVGRYGIDRGKVSRPFYPGGDYKAEDYAGKVVVDNPPFSILSEIIDFYQTNGVRFFLFVPALTCLSGRKHLLELNHIVCNSNVTYENGAVVRTGFITNMEADGTVLEAAPDLGDKLNEVDAELRAATTRNLPKYEYPAHVMTSAKAQWFAAHHTPYKLNRRDCTPISTLDAMDGGGIFGGGLLLSERAAAERAAAERAAAERAAAMKWQLSEREWEIVRGLGRD